MISNRELKVVNLQFTTGESYQNNLDRLVEYIKESRGADIIIAPEVCLTGFDYDNFKEVCNFYQKAIDTLLPVIYREIFVFTIIKRDIVGVVNQATVIHQNRVVYTQNKYKLFKLGGEGKYFVSGNKSDIRVFEIDGIKFSIIICFELRFKDLWKQIENSDIILIPSMWGKPRKEHLEVLSRALAIMNQSFVIVSNSANEDMAKSSAIIHPWGEIYIDDSKDILKQNIKLKEIKRVRRLINMRDD